MRTSALVRVAATLVATTATLALVAPGAQALLPDPAAPVVVDDSVTIYPFGVAMVEVLANDTDPGDPDGSALALCRLPSYDVATGNLPAVMATDSSTYSDAPGRLMVLATRGKLSKPVEVDYYVCNYTRLTPAKLTVSMRSTKPVTVHKVPGKPGRLEVTNHNNTSIVLIWDSGRQGGGRSIGAHRTRLVHVRGTTVKWMAMIGDESNAGLAGRGVVQHVKPDPRDLGKPRQQAPKLSAAFRGLLDRVR